MVSKDALGHFLWGGREECAHKVVGKREQENHKKQNLGLRERNDNKKRFMINISKR